jgi:hypothetical protein
MAFNRASSLSQAQFHILVSTERRVFSNSLSMRWQQPSAQLGCNNCSFTPAKKEKPKMLLLFLFVYPFR